MQIEIVQRHPIVRVITDKFKGYYIDNEGTIMPLSSKYTSRVLIANGNIKPSKEWSKKISIQNIETTQEQELLNSIYQLASYIKQDRFWDAQIQQIYVNESLEFELIPQVGAHTILFGTAKRLEEKFEKLKYMYSEGLKKEGWNKYKTLDLRYKKQVVATKHKA